MQRALAQRSRAVANCLGNCPSILYLPVEAVQFSSRLYVIRYFTLPPGIGIYTSLDTIHLPSGRSDAVAAGWGNTGDDKARSK